jgi:4-hydroxybenzoate polyprenyltransferase
VSPAGWIRLSRWREWAQSKLPFLTGAAFLVWSPPIEVLVGIAATIALWAAFGYGLNEVADRASDAAAGKASRAAGLPASAWVPFLLVAGAGAVGLAFAWGEDAAAPALVLAGLALAYAYSAPPARLKGRGTLGLVAGAAAQWALPVLAVCASEPRGWLEPAALSYALLGLAIGTRWLAVHQRHDVAADRGTGVGTYAARGGRVDRLIPRAFAAEAVLLATTLALAWPHSAPAIGALAVWTLLELTVVSRRNGPLRTRLLRYEAAPFGGYYFFVLPLALAAGRLAL